MAQPHVVTALVEKRSELAGLVEFHRREITRIGADLANLNATIKIFAPDFNLAGIGVKRVRIGKGGGFKHFKHFKHFKQGESQTLVLDLLRVAEQPLTVAMLAAQIIANKGLEDAQDVRISIQRTLSGTLRRLKERGFVVETGKDRDGLTVFWRIA